MKILIAVLLAAGIAVGLTTWLASGRQAETLKAHQAAQARLESEKAALAAALAEAKAAASPALAAAPVANATPVAKVRQSSPAEILQTLLTLKPSTGATRNRTIRLVIFHLESLRDCGPAALPVISDFFAKNQDLDYTTDDSVDPADSGRGGRGGSRWSFRRGGELRTDFVLPPSLRLGLADVVRGIGGPDAEKLLASVLQTTGRGIEVAYIAKTLEEMSPGTYREMALTSAKDLLANPLPIERPNTADDMAEGYLYEVLKSYNDTSFAVTAQAKLITSEGRINRNALDYLNSTLKEQAVPALYQAYNNPALTNLFEKSRIARDVLGYVGENPTANKLLSDIVHNPDYDSRLRGFAIMQLSGGFGDNDSVTAKTYAARIPVLDQLRATVTDTQLLQTIDRTRNNLVIRATNGVPENPWGWGGRGGRGDRGSRGGPPAEGITGGGAAVGD